MSDIETPPNKAKGWPKGKPRGPRERLREVPQNDPNVSYTPEGKAMVRGRDGEWLTRKRPVSTDLFHIPNEIVPPGFSYQWNVMDVLGQQQTAAQLAMAENGWRPVPAGRHKGMFMPADYSENGPILRDGLRLEERPIELTREAQAEERMKADRLMRDQQEQLGLSQKMPDGFSRDNSNLRRMEKSGTSRTYAPAGDIARPQLPIDPAA